MQRYSREQNMRVTLIKFVQIWRREGVLDILNTVQQFIRPSLNLDVSRGHDALGTYVENIL
jgi:spore maturation protein SpmA